MKICEVITANRHVSSNTNNYHCQLLTDYHVVSGMQGKNEADNHADTFCFGLNWLPQYFTGRICDVAPFTDKLDVVKDVEIWSACTAVVLSETGETIIVLAHEGLLFGNRLPHSLINPNQ